MGTVYRAKDLEMNGRMMAVKEMIIGEMSAKKAQEAAEAFQREATLLASFQHLNLSTILDHFAENGR